MALTEVSTPYLISGGDESGLSAANSQAPFEFQRGWDDCILIEDTVIVPGSVQINMDASHGDLTSLFTDGVTIRLAQSFNSIALGLYIVKQSAFTSSQTQIICYETYIENSVDVIIYIEDRENYHVLIEIMLPDNSAPFINQLFTYVPKQNGYLFFDLGPTLAGIMRAFELKYLAYSIRYSEYYDSTQQTPATIAEPVDAVQGRRQIGKLKGANMWDWVLKSVFGRIFTDFHEPKIWKGHTRTLDIVFDIQMGNRINPLNTLTIKYEGMDINKSLDAATSSVSVLPSVWYDNPQMYSLDLQTVIEIPAFSDSEYVKISILDSVTDLIDPLICKIVDPCINQSIMLQWLNDVGGVEQWVFSYNQQVSEDVNIGEIIEIPINEDFSTVRRTKGRTVQDEVQRITMTAENLKENEIRALKYIKSSDQLKVELDGNFYNVVVVGTFSTPWETAHSLHTFAVTIELPIEFDYFEQVPL